MRTRETDSRSLTIPYPLPPIPQQKAPDKPGLFGSNWQFDYSLTMLTNVF